MFGNASVVEILAVLIPSALSVTAIIVSFLVVRPGNEYAKKSYISDIEQRLEDCESKHGAAKVEIDNMRINNNHDKDDCQKRIATLEGEVRALHTMIDLIQERR